MRTSLVTFCSRSLLVQARTREDDFSGIRADLDVEVNAAACLSTRAARQAWPHSQPPRRNPAFPLAAFYRTAVLVINGRTVCGVPVDSGYWGSNVSCGRRYEGFSPSLSALSSARTATATLEPTMSSAAATGCKWPEAASAMPARL